MKKNKLDCVSEFTEKWLAYQKAASMWIAEQERLGLLAVDSYKWFTDDEVFKKFEKTLKDNKVVRPNLWKLRQEATDAAVPILEYLFGPNEIPVIPEFPGSCPGGHEEWHKKTHDMDLDMMQRIMGARNRILNQEIVKFELNEPWKTCYEEGMKWLKTQEMTSIKAKQAEKARRSYVYFCVPSAAR